MSDDDKIDLRGIVERSDHGAYSPPGDAAAPDDSTADPFAALAKEIAGGTGADQGVATIRTSDRILFKRCRRRWGWQSHLRYGLRGKGVVNHFWLGSCFHFLLEDFHGYSNFATAKDGVDAYCRRTPDQVRALKQQGEFDEAYELLIGMMTYYKEEWLRTRQKHETFRLEGVPQVEVNFAIEIPFPKERLQEWGYEAVVYKGTLDAVAIDENGDLWVVEYKTAKSFVTTHYSHDPQCSAYIWSASQLYPGYTVRGVIYQQHRKTLPDHPRILMNGEFSCAKNQTTTYALYRKALRDKYGKVANAPAKNVEFLNYLMHIETPDSDALVRRDPVFRNMSMVQAEGVKIMLEVEDMLNPDLPMYPNPTRNCVYDCPFMSACNSLDDGSDIETELGISFVTAEEKSVWLKQQEAHLLPPEPNQQ